MTNPPLIVLRRARDEDRAFLVDMARLASVIEDWPLPPCNSAEVLEMLLLARYLQIVKQEVV